MVNIQQREVRTCRIYRPSVVFIFNDVKKKLRSVHRVIYQSHRFDLIVFVVYLKKIQMKGYYNKLVSFFYT